MTFWNGTRWVPDGPADSANGGMHRGRRLLGATAEALLIASLTFGLIAGTTLAAKGGNGGGNGNGGNPHAASVAGSCSVDGTTVSGTGLPTDEVLNFMVTDASGTWGWVLGFSGDGRWTESVPPRSGPTTYEFVSRTWGPHGSHYNVFASCSSAS